MFVFYLFKLRVLASLQTRVRKILQGQQRAPVAQPTKLEQTSSAARARARAEAIRLDLNQRRDARATKRFPTAPSKPEIAKELERLSRDERGDAVLRAELAVLDSKDPEKWKPRTLPEGTVFPSKAQLMKDKKFGKPSRNHSYVVTPGFQQVIFFLLKGRFLEHGEILALDKIFDDTKKLDDEIKALQDTDFRPLQHLNLGWNEQTRINEDRARLRLACLLHYDLDFASVQRYCGGRFMGEHRRSEQMLYCLSYILDEETFQALEPGYRTGVPHRLHSNAGNNHEEYRRYRKMGNQKSLEKDPANVMKQLLKEDARDLSFLLPEWILDFVPHCGLLPAGLITAAQKKPRMYRHASKLATKDSQPINTLVLIKETEPEVRFAGTLKRYLTYLWRLRATFPKRRIFQYSDDVAGAFNHRNFHPDVARANVSVIMGWVSLCVALHFGGNFGPSSWEPLSWARCEIVKFLLEHCDYQMELNEEVLAILKPDDSVAPGELASAALDDLNQAQMNPDGTPKGHYEMYIDDSLTALLAGNDEALRKLVASSVEGLYILLGYPGPIKKPTLPPVVAWDKMVEGFIGPQRTNLGVEIDTDWMHISPPDHKLERLLVALCTTWGDMRKTFLPIDAARLLGNLWDLIIVAPWLRVATFHLLDAFREALRKNAARVAHSAHFQALFQQKEREWLTCDDKALGSVFKSIPSEQARMVWRCKVKTFIPKKVREERNWIVQKIKDHMTKKHRWTTPISHVVDRVPDAIHTGDCSLEFGMGGFSGELKFIWQVSWEEIDPRLRETLLNKKGKESEFGLTDINVGEQAALLIGYGACCVAYEDAKYRPKHAPKVLLRGDNKAANARDAKLSIRSDKARALAKIQAELELSTRVGKSTEHIQGIKNVLADLVSRRKMQEALALFRNTHTAAEIRALLQVDSTCTTVTLRVFQPSQELLSRIATALLSPHTVTLPDWKVGNWGQFNPASNITLDLQTKY